MCLSLRECSERGGLSEDDDVCVVVDGCRILNTTQVSPQPQPGVKTLMVVVVLMDININLNINLNNIHRSVPLSKGVFGERRSQWRCWWLCWWMLYRYTGRVFKQMTTPLQAFASPPESARREAVSVKAAVPLASVPAASSYPGQSLTRLLLGLWENLYFWCH